MSGSVEGVVSAAIGLENWAMMQEKDNALLRRVLDNQAEAITNLVDAAVKAPDLAQSGTVGTLLHATA